MADTDNIKKADNTQLDEIVKNFAQSQEKSELGKLLGALENSMVLVPAMPPRNLTEQQQAMLKAGKNVPFNSGVQPEICLLKNRDGEKVFPFFTSKAQIPQDKMPKALLAMPFKAIIRSVTNNGIHSLVIDPFTYGVVFNDKLISVIDERFKAQASGAATVHVGEKEFHAIVHTQVAREGIPERLFKDVPGFMSELRLKKEGLILDIYRSRYSQGVECPYSEDDMAVMMMQIEENLMVVRIDLPEANMVIGGPARLYIVCADNETARYFILEKGGKKQKGSIAEMTAAGGEYTVISDAPDSGAEIETVISLAKPS